MAKNIEEIKIYLKNIIKKNKKIKDKSSVERIELIENILDFIEGNNP